LDPEEESEGRTDYLQLILDVGFATAPVVIWQKILEVQRMKPVLTEETWKAIDEFFRHTPEAPGKLPSLQEAMQEAMQEALAENQRLAERRGRQQTILRLLRHKFPEVSDTVVQRIEGTEDPEWLNAWVDHILDAGTLAEVERGPQTEVSR
jgi:hypothetical protein